MSGASPQAALGRLQELSAELAEQQGTAAAAARELLQLILSLHGQGLARIIELLDEHPDGIGLLERLAQDEQTRPVLLLHDLHPQDLAARVTAAITLLRPHLAVYGIRVEEFSVSNHRLKAALHSSAAPSLQAPPADILRREIESAVYELAPDLEAITLEGLPVPTVYVPLTQLGRTAHAAGSLG